VQIIADLQDQIQQLQEQAHQFLFERGDHLQQILDLQAGHQGLQAQLVDRDAERLVHLEHIQDLLEQVGDLEFDIQALEGVVVMLQQVHHPPAFVDDEQMEIQLDPEEVQDVLGLD
jgi:chromosome segregation ATPase